MRLINQKTPPAETRPVIPIVPLEEIPPAQPKALLPGSQTNPLLRRSILRPEETGQIPAAAEKGLKLPMPGGGNRQ